MNTYAKATVKYFPDNVIVLISADNEEQKPYIALTEVEIHGHYTYMIVKDPTVSKEESESMTRRDMDGHIGWVTDEEEVDYVLNIIKNAEVINEVTETIEI